MSLAPLTVLDVSPANQVIVAAESGYSHVGLRLVPATRTEPIYATIGNTPLIKQIKHNLQQAAIQVLDIEVLRIRSTTRVTDFLPVLETGAELGATEALVTGNDPNQHRLIDNFSLLCQQAAPFGIHINIEPTPWTTIPTIQSAIQLLRKAKQPNQGLLIDPLHFDQAENSLADLKLIPKEYFRYIQLCDGAKKKPKNMAEVIYQARHYRLSPGHGRIDLPALFAMIPARPISIECCNDKLALYKSPIERAKMYLDDSKKLLTSIKYGT